MTYFKSFLLLALCSSFTFACAKINSSSNLQDNLSNSAGSVESPTKQAHYSSSSKLTSLTFVTPVEKKDNSGNEVHTESSKTTFITSRTCPF
jgi:hypothetical protein